MTLRASVFTFCFLFCGSAAPARAELSWVRSAGAEGCATSDELEAELFAQGVPAEQLRATKLEGFVQPALSGFQAQLRVRDSAGELGPVRTLQSTSGECARFTPSIVLMMAMLLGVREPPPKISARLQSDHLSHFELGTLFQSSFGLMVTPGVGYLAAFRFTTRSRVGALLGIGLHYMTARHDIGEPVRVSLRQVAFQLPAQVCVDALRSERFLLVPCAGVLLGMVDGDIKYARPASNDPNDVLAWAVNDTEIRSDFFANATLGIRFAWNFLPTFRLVLDLNAGVALRRPSYRFSGDDLGNAPERVYEAKRFQFMPGLGVARTF